MLTSTVCNESGDLKCPSPCLKQHDKCIDLEACQAIETCLTIQLGSVMMHVAIPILPCNKRSSTDSRYGSLGWDLDAAALIFPDTAQTIARGVGFCMIDVLVMFHDENVRRKKASPNHVEFPEPIIRQLKINFR